MLRTSQTFEQLVAAPVDEFDGHSAIGCPAAPLHEVLVPALCANIPETLTRPRITVEGGEMIAA
jgi:hypothetical protein